MKIKIGHGTRGDIYEDLEKVKACNFCIHFKGYGLHACSGFCRKLNKELTGGYTGGYSKAAKDCTVFEVRPELLEENNPNNKKIDFDKLCELWNIK